jgi:hypothetical protein
MLRNKRDAEFNDEEEAEENAKIGKNDFLLCAKCGAIFHESTKDDPPCGCGRQNYVSVRQAKKTEVRGAAKCPSCTFGNFKLFYLGYDAATAVLGTALFEELPESEKVLKSSNAVGAKKSLFGASKSKPQIDIIKRKRQFLSFSDSRSEAAYFASYMTASYKEFLRRR